MDAINLMMEEHIVIKRGLSILRKMCIAILNGEQVDYEDFHKIIDFVRNYADKHHHSKEEEILFKKMATELGEKNVQGPLSGMYIEHDLGRPFIKTLEESVVRVEKGDQDSRVDVIANSIGYADLLNRHIDKEDKVIYTFAKRALSKVALDDLNEKCDMIENIAKEKQLQEKYANAILDLENKWS